jgi:hypothetical protein
MTNGLFSVIPAQAGIQQPAGPYRGALDSRLRGNDERARMTNRRG